jgi:hypothetical protein
MIECHRKLFMERAFSPQGGDDEDDKGVGVCRLEEELDLIAYVASLWQTRINMKKMEECPDRDWLVKIQRKYELGNKWVTLFHAKEILVAT